MAATQDIQSTQLRLVFENGVDGKGKVIYKNKNYNNINPASTADQLYSVAVAIEGLQSLQLFNIERNDSYMLAGDGQ
ncbi:DUF1659 domain-containing protein [Bacillus timonensis]|uniref:DUF1659 domain-containing protein n=1 Tax=Bacillus timonensis TaxID=1033734 RepID=UPI0002892278|nr:DUF1659 domain-containing protein [Bacillus timonensis]